MWNGSTWEPSPPAKSLGINLTKETYLSTSTDGAPFSVSPYPNLQPFDFQSRTRVVFGEGILNRIGELVRELGGERVLLVSDAGIRAAGHVRRALQSMEDAGLIATLFDGVEENPTTRHVEAALEVAREHRPDLIVGLGGGSSLDCAKGVNFVFTNGGRIADYWGVGKAVRPMLPLIGVPTTAGTGSEAQSFALISDEKTHRKMACGDKNAACAVAILDPQVTLTQPARVTAMTGIDAVAHSVESFVTTQRSPVSQLFAREAWKLLQGNFLTVVKDPENRAARAAMLLGAHYAGLAIENSMLGATHACANPLTAHYDMPHGLAVALMLPHVVRFNAAAVEELYAQLAALAGMRSAEDLAAEIESMRRAARIPESLSEWGINREDMATLAREAVEQWTAKFNPRRVSEEDLRALYERAF